MKPAIAPAAAGWLGAALLAVTALAAPQKARVEPVRYNRDIRPLLSDNCFACHGPDKNKRQAGLRLDRRDDALKAGALVPGKPEKSPLVARIFAAGASQMPPAAFHKTLTADQKALLRRWIAEGAVYEPHWAYAPLVSPPVPTVRTRDWARGPIDAFVLARLEREGIAPSLEADRATLIRRVSLDLTGLPPTPAEVDAFVGDTRPDAYERVVDRLLASPHYGERMAVPWLDSVRYADTVGFHGDQNANAWAYRDWVIDAFNANKRFDVFTTEQLAGDLLPNPTPEQRTATCVNRLNMVTREGGAQPGEYLHKYAADRVRTVGMAWLGSTFACAECHDHKYDPIAQRDFYSLAAFFGDVRQWGVYADYDYTPNPELRGVGNDHPFFPERIVESRFLRERIARERAQIARAAAGAKVEAAALDTWRTEQRAFLAAHPDGWEAGAILPGATESVALKPGAARIAAVRLDLLPESGSVLKVGVGEATIRFTAQVAGLVGAPRPVTFRYAAADAAAPRYDGGAALLGIGDGWRLTEKEKGAARTSVWLPDRPVVLAPGEALRLSVTGKQVARWRVAVSPLAPEDPDAAALPTYPSVLLADPARARRAWLLSTGGDAVAFAAAVKAEAQIAACRRGRTPVMVTEAATRPLVLRVLPRGNWQDESGPIAPPATPSFLPKAGVPTDRALTRLDLARWLTSRENPLVPRVFVNRIWKQLFGNGLCGTVEDLGAQGETPSHPELLDWLAASFRADWDIKALVRRIVLSSTYRQSAKLRRELRERDPANRLLASQNPRRLEAEFVRDNALAIAGLLNRRLGGPPVKPYQPAGYYAALQFPDRDYVADRDDQQWRRGLYMHWQRTFLHPMLANFDAPSREDPVCTRTVANTPQQALTLLNDPEFVEAARAFATSLPAGADDAKIAAVYKRALARQPGPAEVASLRTFLGSFRAAYRGRPDDAKKLLAVGYSTAPTGDPVELAAWTQLCRVVLNLHETITRY